jgi:excinuclease ABC subunit C
LKCWLFGNADKFEFISSLPNIIILTPMENTNSSEDKLALQVAQLPHLPGVYKFFDKEKILLYVGKAKDLKNRVNSYFIKSNQLNRKTQRLVSQIDTLEYTIVNNERDALLLENNLIKTNQPKYNILLKDDKSYPYICVTAEPFPKIIVTRQPDKVKGTLYGPFSNVKAMYAVLDLIKKLYPLRNCQLLLSAENIQAQKFKVCLEYHIGNCLGPCEGKQNEPDYIQQIYQAEQILKGDIGRIKNYFQEQMYASAENLEFEKAEAFKQKLALLDSFQSKSLIVNAKIQAIDVCTIIADEDYAYINYLIIKDGRIIHTQNQEVRKKLEESDEEVLGFVLFHLRQQCKSTSQEIITNIPLTFEESSLLLNTVPKIGDKKKLVDLSMKNTIYFKQEKRRLANQKSADNPTQAVLELQKALQLKNPPIHIECFDNSNIQGTNPVASMVFFQNGKPFKKEYRHFNIKTVEGPDDFASMREIVMRRYKRLLDESKPLPDLILIDGGKGQLSSACEALKELNLYGKIPIVGIAKRLEEIYFPEDEIPLHISKKSLALKLIQQARNEAHRFAITFHRLKRSQNSIQTQLSSIKGIGEATIEALLKEFKTIKNIKEQSLEDLAKVVGKAKAEVLKNSL